MLKTMMLLLTILFQGCIHTSLMTVETVRKEWRYHNDGYAHCYVNGVNVSKYSCSEITRPPRIDRMTTREWRYHNDGYAHCYVNGKNVSKSRCSGKVRPPKRD
jgi:hypothetical protein